MSWCECESCQRKLNAPYKSVRSERQINQLRYDYLRSLQPYFDKMLQRSEAKKAMIEITLAEAIDLLHKEMFMRNGDWMHVLNNAEAELIERLLERQSAEIEAYKKVWEIIRTHISRDQQSMEIGDAVQYVIDDFIAEIAKLNDKADAMRCCANCISHHVIINESKCFEGLPIDEWRFSKRAKPVDCDYVCDKWKWKEAERD